VLLVKASSFLSGLAIPKVLFCFCSSWGVGNLLRTIQVEKLDLAKMVGNQTPSACLEGHTERFEKTESVISLSATIVRSINRGGNQTKQGISRIFVSFGSELRY